MSRALRSLLLFTTLIVTPLLAAAQRVVAIGDIHGEYEGFVSILFQAGLIDQKLRWIGGATTLVQTGDFLDRGPDVRKVMDLLMALEQGASRRRGRAIVLLGNHELMNLTSIFQDQNPRAYAAFADRNSEKRRKAAYREYVALREGLSQRYPEASLKTEEESAWMETHPPGFIEFQAALARNGKYGRWLRSKSAVAKVDDSVFLHGGISPKGEPKTIEEINKQVRLEIEGFDRIREYLVAQKLILPFFTYQEISEAVNREAARGEAMSRDMRLVTTLFKAVQHWSIYDPDGPLWFRGFGEWSDEEGERHVAELLNRFGARRFVVGHTIPADASQILPRFGGKVFLIDTGMLRNYAKNGRPAALEITGGTYAAIYESGRVVLHPSPQSSLRRQRSSGAPYLLLGLTEDATTRPPQHVWRGPKGTTLPFRTGAEVTDFLRRARLVQINRKKLGGVTKPQKVLIESNGLRANAVFRSLHREEENAKWESGVFTEFLRDTYKSEIAAYELSLLLGLDTVPPTIPWQIKRREGSLQIWIENARPGWHPQEREKPPDVDRWLKELDKMRAFDALIGNIDRHEANVLVDAGGKVWWIDHSRSFGRERTLFRPEEIKRCERRLFESLRSLDPKIVAERLAPYMSSQEIDALIVRRDQLIKLIEQRIKEHGETEVLFTLEPESTLRRTIAFLDS